MLIPPGLTVSEAAVGQALIPAPPVALPASRRRPLEALERVVAERLAAGRCAVAFSGGRDSSLLLAAAVRSARAEGLEPPVAVTLRYPGLSEAEESRWQERVIAHLKLDDWIRVEIHDELDLIGPTAADVLRRHGVFFPANAHSLIPMLNAVPAASLLVGLGGDELLDRHRFTPVNNLLARRRRPGVRDARWLAAAVLPPALRGVAFAIGERDAMPWLRPRTRRRVLRLEAREAAEPVSFSRYAARAAADRNLTLAVGTLNRFGASLGVSVHAPLIDPRFVAAVAGAAGRHGFGGRRAAMRAILGDALPAEVVQRSGKATFTGTFFGDATRAFAAAWSGHGLDERVVRPEQLRRIWRSTRPDFRTALLLQSAWLHDDRMRQGR